MTLSLLTTVTSNAKCFIVDSFVSVGAIVFVYCLVCCHLTFTSFGTFWYCVYYCHFKFGKTFFSWYHCLQCRSLIHCQRWMRSICSVRLGYIIYLGVSSSFWKVRKCSQPFCCCFCYFLCAVSWCYRCWTINLLSFWVIYCRLMCFCLFVGWQGAWLVWWCTQLPLSFSWIDWVLSFIKLDCLVDGLSSADKFGFRSKQKAHPYFFCFVLYFYSKIVGDFRNLHYGFVHIILFAIFSCPESAIRETHYFLIEFS